MNVDTRPRSHTARRRVLTVFSFLAATIAVLVAVAAFSVASPAADVVLDVETATLAPEPSPETPTPPPTTTSVVPGTTEPPTPTTTTSTTLPPQVPPTALAIGDLGISQRVLPVGLNDDGTMEVPDVSDIGWYLHGATPGLPGATVLVAHVWWDDTPGPFRRLGTLEPGARIEVSGERDTIHEYVVVERTMYNKDALPTDLWRKTGPETLVLITCGGDFNKTTRRYNQNIVIYAHPIQNTNTPQST